MKKFDFVLLMLFSAASCFSAKFSDLTNDDAGQLVFRRSDSAVFVFQKVTEKKYWRVNVFRGDGQMDIHPYHCEVLEFTDDALSPDDIVIHLIYWNLVRPGSPRAKALYRICQKINSPLGDKVKNYYIERQSSLRRLSLARNEYLDEIRTVERTDDGAAFINAQAIQASGSGASSTAVKTSASVAQDFVDKAMLVLENNSALAVVQSLADSDQNLLAAFLLFCDYQREFYRRIPRMSRKEIDSVTKEVNKTGEDIIAKYRAKRTINRKRETDFKALCPRKHGAWEYAAPVGINEMMRRVVSCYNAFCKLNSCSAMSEFPEWGSAALEVMQMTNSIELERKFDSAVKMYQKRINP